jgi:cytochrome b subunit of formate dehydrogenase
MEKIPMTLIKRFTPAQRLFHLVLVFCFLIQSATGLARMYITTDWGRGLSSLFGGYYGTLAIHWWVGLFMLAALCVHVVYLFKRVDWRRLPGSIYGPDSILPRLEDAGQAVQHIGWFLGLSKYPHIDRWIYLEKFDYWAVFWGICILGSTGVILYNPVFFSHYMPGWILNVLLWVHRIEAILAMGHVFIIHFFIGHLRRNNFPMDMAMFEGSVDLARLRLERPAWVARMERSGTLESQFAFEVTVGRRVLFYIFGYAAVVIGVLLLIGGLVNSTAITW